MGSSHQSIFAVIFLTVIWPVDILPFVCIYVEDHYSNWIVEKGEFMSRIAYIVFFALLVVPCISDAETIDVQIKGVDDGARTTKQRDYKEAVLFAKREAIERAGVKIKSMTTVKDLVVNSDYIESKAEAVLLPGYNILDMGYSSDGTYQVVLIGKVKNRVRRH